MLGGAILPALRSSSTAKGTSTSHGEVPHHIQAHTDPTNSHKGHNPKMPHHPHFLQELQWHQQRLGKSEELLGTSAPGFKSPYPTHTKTQIQGIPLHLEQMKGRQITPSEEGGVATRHTIAYNGSREGGNHDH